MHLSVTILIVIALLLILFSSLFSLAEISVMSINRYRLRHLVRQNNRAAIRVSGLLERPDRLLGAILIGDTFADILASAIATDVSVRMFGAPGVVIAAVVVTLLVLLLGQMIPKTLGAIYSQQIALAASIPLKFFLKLIYPLVIILNGVSNSVIHAFGAKPQRPGVEHLSTEELRTLVYEAGGRIPAGHKSMLLRILDIGKVTVEDVMVSRTEILGLDIEADWETVLSDLLKSHHTRLPVYSDSIDQLHGILHLRTALHLLAKNNLNRETLLHALEDAYFIPEGTALNTQLLNFRHEHKRSGLVVDEYGDIQGWVALEDILEEIVGEFTASVVDEAEEVQLEADGSYVVDAGANIRDLNRLMNWKFSIEGPKTLSGLIIEYLESIPSPGLCIRLSGYPVEILEVADNMVKSVRIMPKLREKKKRV
jgi:Mg2+/Co2+ transporter CorB